MRSQFLAIFNFLDSIYYFSWFSVCHHFLKMLKSDMGVMRHLLLSCSFLTQLWISLQVFHLSGDVELNSQYKCDSNQCLSVCYWNLSILPSLQLFQSLRVLQIDRLCQFYINWAGNLIHKKKFKTHHNFWNSVNPFYDCVKDTVTMKYFLFHC